MISSKKPKAWLRWPGRRYWGGIRPLANLEVHGCALIVAQDVELHGAFVAKLLEECEYRARVANVHAIDLLENVPVFQTDLLIKTGRVQYSLDGTRSSLHSLGEARLSPGIIAWADRPWLVPRLFDRARYALDLQVLG